MYICRYIYGVYLCVPGPVRVLTVVYRRVRMVEGGHTGVRGHPPVLFQIYTHGQWLWQVSLYLTMRNINEQIWYVGLESVTCFIHTNISYAVFIQKVKYKRRIGKWY